MFSSKDALAVIVLNVMFFDGKKLAYILIKSDIRPRLYKALGWFNVTFFNCLQILQIRLEMDFICPEKNLKVTIKINLLCPCFKKLLVMRCLFSYYYSDFLIFEIISILFIIYIYYYHIDCL